MSARIYLDHNATAPLRAEARAAMLEAMDAGGNPSSVHAEGRRARAIMEEAREQVAEAVGVPARSVIFTSGGTEANNLALKGASVDRLIVSAVEHPSVIEAARATSKPLHLLEVDAEGVVKLDGLERALVEGEGRALVSVMLANNETGALQPVREVASIAARHGALVHTDAAQAVGRIPVDYGDLGVDLMSLSAHKFAGPAGVGALVAKDGLAMAPLVSGGGQELRRRAGTENVGGIAGLAAALKAAVAERETVAARMSGLRAELEAALDALEPDAHIFSRGTARLPNTTCFALPGTGADLLLMALDLDGIAVSSGSACSSGKVAASHVLKAMGVEPALAGGAIRVSLGRETRREDIEALVLSLKTVLDRLGRRAAA